jgi:hypothetical protein
MLDCFVSDQKQKGKCGIKPSSEISRASCGLENECPCVSRASVPSFLEYGEYPYVSSYEIKKALKLKVAFSNTLDQMQ